MKYGVTTLKKFDSFLCPHRDLYVIIHGNIILNNPKLEITQMSIKWWIDKQNSTHAMEGYSSVKRMKYW